MNVSIGISWDDSYPTTLICSNIRTSPVDTHITGVSVLIIITGVSVLIEGTVDFMGFTDFKIIIVLQLNCR